MYAVIKTGGKQYRVSHGDRLKVEALKAEAGSTIQIDDILMVGDGENVTIGTPIVDNASVSATVLGHGKGKKVKIIKFRRRKHHRKQMGHRQQFTELEITGISANGVTSSAPAKEEAAAAPAEAPIDAAPVESSPVESSAEDSAAEPAAPLQFLDAPQGEKDELTTINGIGPVIEEKLNAMGIYHFHQIADFTEENIEAVNEQLSFKGRIQREEWVEQAKKLVAGAE